MRRRRQRGSTVEFIPVAMMAILLLVGSLQIALYMSAKYFSELASFRASRIVEEDAGKTGRAQAEAIRCCRLGYPAHLGSTTMQRRSSKADVRVRFHARPFFPFPAEGGSGKLGDLMVNADYPPPLVTGKAPQPKPVPEPDRANDLDRELPARPVPDEASGRAGDNR